MTAYNKFNAFVQNLANKRENLGADLLKVMLTNTVPVATNSVYSDIIEIPAGNGYVAGGSPLAIASSAQIGGVYILLPSGAGLVTFTASGGAMSQFRYPVLYNSISSDLIAWFDNLSPVTLVPAQSFIVAFNIVNGVLQIQ